MRIRLLSLLSLILIFAGMLSTSPVSAAANDKSRYFTTSTTITGMQAHFSTMVSASLPTQSVAQRYYLEMRPQNSCIAVAVLLERAAGSGSGVSHGFYFSDYCAGGGSYIRDMASNVAFRDIYVRTQTYNEPAGTLGSRNISDETVVARIGKNANGTWTGYLYNHTTGAWDAKLTSIGTSNASDAYVSAYWISNGTPTACSTLGTYGHGTIWDTKLQRGVGNAYNLAQFSDVDALDNNTMYCTDTTSNPWQFSNIAPADDLIVRTPAA